MLLLCLLLLLLLLCLLLCYFPAYFSYFFFFQNMIYKWQIGKQQHCLHTVKHMFQYRHMYIYTHSRAVRLMWWSVNGGKCPRCHLYGTVSYQGASARSFRFQFICKYKAIRQRKWKFNAQRNFVWFSFECFTTVCLCVCVCMSYFICVY